MKYEKYFTNERKLIHLFEFKTLNGLMNILIYHFDYFYFYQENYEIFLILPKEKEKKPTNIIKLKFEDTFKVLRDNLPLGLQIHVESELNYKIRNLIKEINESERIN
jgi:hypothetical protein